MKVLILSWNFPPIVGGIEYVVENIWQGLLSRNNDVRVLTAHTSEPVAANVAVIRAPKPGLCNYVLFSLWKSLSLARSWRPDVVVCGTVVGALAAYLLKLVFHIPYAVLVHGTDVLRGGRLGRILIKFLLRRASGVGANSKNTERIVRSIGVASDKVQVIYPGVKSELFVKEPAAGAEKILPEIHGRRTLLYVGRLIRRKGMLELVENVLPKLVKKYPDVVLVVVGEDAKASLAHKERLKDKLVASIKTLGLEKHVILAGSLKDEDVIRLYYHAHVFVLPALDLADDVEGFGIVFSEAALANLPTVATRVGGIPEAVVDGETGLLVEGGDYEGIVQAISRLFDDDPLRRKLGAAAARRAEASFSWPVIVAQYDRFLAELTPR